MTSKLVALCVFLMIFSLNACGKNVEDLAHGAALIERTLSIEILTPTQIFIQTNDQQTITVQLNDSRAARSFYDQLPLIVAVEDDVKDRKIFYPPTRLDISDAPVAIGPRGTVAYYEPWGIVVIFTEECRGAKGLYELGEVVANDDLLSKLSGELKITASLETSENSIPEQPVIKDEMKSESPLQEEVIEHDSSQIESTTPPIKEEEMEENTMHPIAITIGNQSFRVSLYKSATSDSLMERLPFTLEMDEMNGNEKYAYLAEEMPTAAIVPSTIHAGDLMLFGNDCLVLFYESFTSSYSYTPLGYVEDLAGFKSALGSGKVEVSFYEE